MSRYPDGYYVIVTAAGGAMGTIGGPPNYPRWLRVYLILLVSMTWTGLLILSAIAEDRTVPTWVHLIMGVVCASLFSVEFGGIRLITKKDEPNAD